MADQFSDLGKVEAIRRLYADTKFAPQGAGWFETGGKAYVSSFSRLFVEGIDFNLVYFPLRHLGYKCVVAVTGELYAEMSRPRLLNVVLGISAKLDFPEIQQLWSGIAHAAAEQGYAKVSIDLVPSPNGLSISLSATGETALSTDGHRPAGKSKDLICISGSLGAAYLGLQVLEREKRAFERAGAQPGLERYRMLIGAYLKPEIDPEIVQHLEEAEIYPSYGYLVSKGLAEAVKRLAEDSGFGAKIYADKIPFEGNSFETGKELNIDPVSAAMNGGDDFRLLFVIPILEAEKFRREFQTFDVIGHLARPEAGTVLVTPDGAELPLKAQGWPDP